MKCHCGKRLKKDTNEVRGTIYKCSCGCIYRLTIVQKSVECSRKEYKEELRSLKQIKKEKTKGKKRGRRKRKA